MRVDLFAVQPYMTLDDYASESAFSRKIDSLLQQTARLRDPASQAALAVFPEDLATFLVIANRGSLIGNAHTLDEAFARIGKHLFPSIIATMAKYRTRSLKEAFFVWTAKDVWRIWYTTMTQLAKKYNITIVAGSALLPQNRLHPNPALFRAQSARIFNFSFTIDPRGQILYSTRKVNLVPTQEDVLDLSPGPLDAAAAVCSWNQIPMATAICYDGFRVPHTTGEPDFTPLMPLLDKNGARIVAQPSANPWWWQEPWVFDQPPKHRTRRQQWWDEGAMAALADCRSIEVVINPQLLLQLLDVHFDGTSVILARTPHDGIQILAQSADYQARPEAEEIVHARWEFS